MGGNNYPKPATPTPVQPTDNLQPAHQSEIDTMVNYFTGFGERLKATKTYKDVAVVFHQVEEELDKLDTAASEEFHTIIAEIRSTFDAPADEDKHSGPTGAEGEE